MILNNKRCKKRNVAVKSKFIIEDKLKPTNNNLQKKQKYLTTVLKINLIRNETCTSVFFITIKSQKYFLWAYYM